MDTVLTPLCIMVGVNLVCSAIALRAWQQSWIGRLGWDGQTWHFSAWPDSVVMRLKLVLDLQWVMLVRVWTQDGRGTWLWLESDHPGPTWNAMRRALVLETLKPMKEAR
jgi:hypothetical protein